MMIQKIPLQDLMKLGCIAFVMAAMAAFSNSPEKTFLVIGAALWGFYFVYTFLAATKKKKTNEYWSAPWWLHALVVFSITVVGSLCLEISQYRVLGIFDIFSTTVMPMLSVILTFFFGYIVKLSHLLRDTVKR